MKIAITWASWFVWKYLVEYFSKENEVIAFSRQKIKDKKNVVNYFWDLNNEITEKLDFDVFIHSASDTWYEKSKKDMIKNNVLSNENVVNLIKKSNCKHFIYISSSSVYMWNKWIIDENTKIKEENLVNSYSLSKYLAEKYLIEKLPKKIKLTILRPRAIYWEWDKVLEPNILKHQIFKKLILLWNWKNITSLTDVNYFVKVCEIVIKNQKNNFEIFNISDKKTKTMNEIYIELVKKYNLKWIIKLPIFILKIFYFVNKNKISYLIDSFWEDKILSVKKIEKLSIF